MKFSIAISALIGVLAIQVASAAPADEVDCSKMDDIIDEYGAAQGFTSLNPKYKLASTPEEFTSRCKEMKDAVKVLRKYNNKCYNGLTQQVFSSILRTRATHNEEYCNVETPEGKQAFESVKCIRENALEKTVQAEKNLILYSQVLLDMNIPDEKLRVRNACCAIVAGKKIFLDAFAEKCGKYNKVYTSYVDSYSSEAMGLICQDPDKLECDKLEKIKYEGVEAKSKFFLNPMLKLVKTLDHSKN